MTEVSAEHASTGAEAAIRWAVQWLKLGIETVGAGLVCVGVLIAILQMGRHLMANRMIDFTGTRLTLARYLALALEFQLGADILSTAIAPSWQEIGRLASIAVIRTGLNFFLSQEMKQEREIRDAEQRLAKEK